MSEKIIHIVGILKSLEEKACSAGFDIEGAKQHVSLIQELKAECDVNHVDCRDLVKNLPLAPIDFAFLALCS